MKLWRTNSAHACWRAGTKVFDAHIRGHTGNIIQLERILQSQGFGSRKQCRALIESGRVSIAGAVCDDARQDFTTTGLQFSVDEQAWQFHDKVYLLLHKPAGYECSRNPQHHPSVLSLLPAPLRERGVQCVGRLDEDTSGLLLLTDDGPWLHRLTHPKRHVPKRYTVCLKHPATEAMLQALQQGVLLHGDEQPVCADELVCADSHTLLLSIDQGKYHQVKRMVAAAGNRVEALHRQRFGQLDLGTLAPGEWRYLSAAEQALAGAG